MYEIEFFANDLSEITSPLAVLTFEEDGQLRVAAGGAELLALATAVGAKGKAGEVLRCPAPPAWGAPYVFFVGLGEPCEQVDRAESLRRAAGAVSRAITEETLALAFGVQSEEERVAVLEGATLGAYRANRYLSDKKTGPQRFVLVGQALPEKAVERIVALAEGVDQVRELVNMSPSELYPQALAQKFTEGGAALGVTSEVWDFERLKAEGFGGIVGVGQGSSRKPCLVHLEYKPAAAKAHVALVGKGITYDSGGLSLKPSSSMVTMKTDMTGAATLAWSLITAARLQLPVRVSAWLCLAENLVSSTSQRPDDVLVMKSGKTVEVTNTDAEGRLVLADGLTMAAGEDPDLIIDMATLTGAQIIALGNRYAGVMGTDIADYLAAAQQAGEHAWGMPLPKYLRSNLDSPIADIANSASKREGGMLIAGLFLQEFVEGKPWAHVDIAGPSFNTGSAWGYTPAQATGYGLRTVVGLLQAKAGL